MRTLLATALLLGISSLTVARAEWEILDPGTAVGPRATAPVAANTLDNPLPAARVADAPTSPGDHYLDALNRQIDGLRQQVAILEQQMATMSMMVARTEASRGQAARYVVSGRASSGANPLLGGVGAQPY